MRYLEPVGTMTDNILHLRASEFRGLLGVRSGWAK